jgi:hypothetical protein
MSKQLILSAALSVIAMAGAALFSVPGIAAPLGSAAALIEVKASAEAALPALGTLLPGLR